MDQHKKRRLLRWTSYVRRDRFLTLLGSLIIFATFVAKEAIGENLKILISSIEAATNLFVMREDIAFTTGFVRRPLPADPTLDEMRGLIDLWDVEVLDLLPICQDLAQSLPDGDQFEPRAQKIDDEHHRITAAVIDIRRLSPESDREILAATRSLYDRSLHNFVAANTLRANLFDHATHLRESRQAYYNAAKWASYILFTIGWSLTFYGQLSGNAHASKEN